jgi:hypothetical protein
MNTRIEDYRLKPLQKFYRPYFSPHFNNYEMDYAVSNFLININNVKCNVFNVTEKYIKNSITIPIYCTKYLAEEKSIPQKYKELFGGVMN